MISQSWEFGYDEFQDFDNKVLSPLIRRLTGLPACPSLPDFVIQAGDRGHPGGKDKRGNQLIGLIANHKLI